MSEIDSVLRRAAARSSALADARLARLPRAWLSPGALGSAPSRRPGLSYSTLVIATLSCLVLVGTGVTWAVIRAPAATPSSIVQQVPTLEIPTLGEALRQERRPAGPRRVPRVQKQRAPTPKVVEKAPPRRHVAGGTRVAKRGVVARDVTVAAEASGSGKAASQTGTVVFDQPNGDVIIVTPKAKQGPLWTPKDFGRYMRMRRRSLSY